MPSPRIVGRPRATNRASRSRPDSVDSITEYKIVMMATAGFSIRHIGETCGVTDGTVADVIYRKNEMRLRDYRDGISAFAQQTQSEILKTRRGRRAG